MRFTVIFRATILPTQATLRPVQLFARPQRVLSTTNDTDAPKLDNFTAPKDQPVGTG